MNKTMAVYDKLKETTIDFGSDTSSMHGVPHVILSKTKRARVVWALVCLTAIGWFIYMLGALIAKYVSYPVNVRMNEVCIITPAYRGRRYQRTPDHPWFLHCGTYCHDPPPSVFYRGRY